ncbi:MAG: peptide deformylase [Eubacteriales bacterium]|nr:peptide deformylase [Eubacteriales bacterium]MDY3332790.1 peptide deformylase [Gallibacter sp.]
MAIRKILVEGDPLLNKVSRDVMEITPRIKVLIEDMIETMNDAQGVGIAAPQVGVLRRICIITNAEMEPKVLINPEIIASEGEQNGSEGCLSIPGYVGEVVRPQKITVRYNNEDMKEIVEDFEDFAAVVASHEIDHLYGILYRQKADQMYDLDDLQDEE